MAFIPTRQFQLGSPAGIFFNSFQSFPKFHGHRLHFFRYSSSHHFEKRVLFVTRGKLDAEPKQSNFVNKNKPSSHRSPETAVSNNNWLDKWTEGHKQSRPKPPVPVADYGNSESDSDAGYTERNSRRSIAASGRRDGVGGRTMEEIVEKLKKFGDEVDSVLGKENERVVEMGSVEDIFREEEGILPNTRGGFSRESPLGIGTANGVVRFPWEKPKEEEEAVKSSVRRKSKTSLAEQTLSESELRRLKRLTFEKKHKTRIGGGGVTQAVVEMIHERWKTSEIVRLKFEGDAALNMRRMHEVLERKTGGLVIWRSGNSVSLYRGAAYEVPSAHQSKRTHKKNVNSPSSLFAVDIDPSKYISDVSTQAPKETSRIPTNDYREDRSPPEVKYEDEVDRVLDSLGPRYADWPGCDPLPVDADRLPPVVAGFEPPFRLLPYGIRPSLAVREATALRHIARTLPPHFALGRNRQLQGLAAAIIKLWEKSSIAKIALKRGVQLTTSERMAEDIKKLTGGLLLSRNKDFLVFYRGKDFLSPEVTEALREKEILAKSLEDDEEQARLRASALVMPSAEALQKKGTAGTLEETLDANAKWGKRLNDHHKKQVMQEAELLRHARLVHKLESKLALAEKKISRAESALVKVEQCLQPAESPAEPESITDEERFMFRKLGLKMKAYLLLGRRGVFDGTIENMHLHWRYRELVKVLVNVKTFEEVKKVALALEAESGGVLVSVDKISKGYAVVVYRGKDYQRPSTLRPKNLLTKRKALARSIELQRREALISHISGLRKRVDKLRSEIEQMESVRHRGDETLYDKLESAYPSDDDASEGESDGENHGTYENENNDAEIYKSGISIRQETEFPSNLMHQEDEDAESDLGEIDDDMYGTEGDTEDENDIKPVKNEFP